MEDETEMVQDNFENKRVLVTVGSTKHEDLIEAIDEPDLMVILECEGFEQIYIQKGFTIFLSNLIGDGDYTPHKIQNSSIDIQIVEYLPSLLEEIKSSDLIITHAGTGTIFECLGMRKRVLG